MHVSVYVCNRAYFTLYHSLLMDEYYTVASHVCLSVCLCNVAGAWEAEEYLGDMSPGEWGKPQWAVCHSIACSRWQLRPYVHTYIRTHICTYVHTYLWGSRGLLQCTYVRTYVCQYVCVCFKDILHTCISFPRLSWGASWPTSWTRPAVGLSCVVLDETTPAAALPYSSSLPHYTVQWCVHAWRSLCPSTPADELPYIECPLHTVVRLTPQAYGEKQTAVTCVSPSVHTYCAQGAV